MKKEKCVSNRERNFKKKKHPLVEYFRVGMTSGCHSDLVQTSRVSGSSPAPVLKAGPVE